MKCGSCNQKAIVNCRCGVGYCALCGIDQGTYDGKFASCKICDGVLSIKNNISNEWNDFFKNNCEELEKIERELLKRKDCVKIFPPSEYIFNAFQLRPSEIKVVILGQDPYHGEGQAMGLSFSVRKGVRPPPSLINIFKEMTSDGFHVSDWSSGDLSPWTKQGVLLYNMALTVEEKSPGKHLKIWKSFSENLLQYINNNCRNVVFILWGNPAQKNETLISKEHYIIKSTHPSPLSAHSGFFGSKPFSKTNEFLKSKGKEIINWNL